MQGTAVNYEIPKPFLQVMGLTTGVDGCIVHDYKFVMDEPSCLNHQATKGGSSAVVPAYCVDGMLLLQWVSIHASNHIVGLPKVAAHRNKLCMSQEWAMLLLFWNCV
jgi:hypothetical protein